MDYIQDYKILLLWLEIIWYEGSVDGTIHIKVTLIAYIAICHLCNCEWKNFERTINCLQSE